MEITTSSGKTTYYKVTANFKAMYGSIGRGDSTHGFVKNVISALEPSSNMPLKYHHSKVFGVGSVRIPSS